jgi:hypothetical protein
VLGFGATQIGLAFLPVAPAIGTLSLGFAARLITRFGARATLLPGLVLIVAGLLWFQRVPVDADYLRDIFPLMLLLGVGGGLSFPSLMTLAMQAPPKRLRPGRRRRRAHLDHAAVVAGPAHQRRRGHRGRPRGSGAGVRRGALASRGSSSR